MLPFRLHGYPAAGVFGTPSAAVMARDPSALHEEILELVEQDLTALRRDLNGGAMTREQRGRLRDLEAMVVTRMRVDIELEALANRAKGQLGRAESLAVIEELLRSDPDVRQMAARALRAGPS